MRWIEKVLVAQIAFKQDQFEECEDITTKKLISQA